MKTNDALDQLTIIIGFISNNTPYLAKVRANTLTENVLQAIANRTCEDIERCSNLALMALRLTRRLT